MAFPFPAPALNGGLTPAKYHHRARFETPRGVNREHPVLADLLKWRTYVDDFRTVLLLAA
jgi:hypothetical protein